MTDIDAVAERLRAVERAVADGDAETDLTDPTDDLEARIEDLEAETTDLESGLQAVRGYVGRVRSVDDEIEERAEAALSAVDAVEDRIAELERRIDADGGDAVDPPDAEIGSGGDHDQSGSYEAHEARPPAGHSPGNRAMRRRSAEPKRHRRRTRQHAGWAPAGCRAGPSDEYDAGCPYCGTAGTGDRDAEDGRPPNRDRAQRQGMQDASDGAPVDGVDEQGIVARLRDAL